jgi:hypothetical protein
MSALTSIGIDINWIFTHVIAPSLANKEPTLKPHPVEWLHPLARIAVPANRHFLD